MQAESASMKRQPSSKLTLLLALGESHATTAKKASNISFLSITIRLQTAKLRIRKRKAKENPNFLLLFQGQVTKGAPYVFTNSSAAS